MQKFSFQSMENSRIQIAANYTTADLKIRIIGTSCPGTPVLPLPRVRPLLPGISLKTGLMMTPMKTARRLSA
jgi:hypothetical protein